MYVFTKLQNKADENIQQLLVTLLQHSVLITVLKDCSDNDCLTDVSSTDD